jgi:proteasome lid subunit RPN8/RPN11
MGIPKIPISILKGIYLFFNYISDEYETEVRVQVFFDPNRKMYEVYLPNQEVTSASIYTLDAEYAYMQKTGYWPVLDIHSHCRYPAIFSATDNNYEKGSWIYGVIGSLGRFPQLLLRAGSGGYYVPICERDVFDLSAASDDSMCTQVYEKLVGQQDRLQKMDGD